jgi:hypothetical protein
MSAGRRRLRRLILQSVKGTRYGCTRGQLAYQVYGIDRGDGPSEAHLWAVDQAVARLLDDGLVVERTMLGTQRYLFPASPSMLGSGARTLQCLDCDLLWVSEEGAPHLLCWSCGEPGLAVALRTRRMSQHT